MIVNHRIKKINTPKRRVVDCETRVFNKGRDYVEKSKKAFKKATKKDLYDAQGFFDHEKKVRALYGVRPKTHHILFEDYSINVPDDASSSEIPTDSNASRNK